MTKPTAYGIGSVGDLWVGARPEPKLAAALQVIGTYLHSAYDFENRIVVGKSKESCILMAATVRDFLYRVGFRDASVRPVVFWIEAIRDDVCIKQLGIGNPEGPQPMDDAFDGHMIVTTGDWIIDPTLYHATPRPEWPSFPAMMATTRFSFDPPLIWQGLPALAGGAVDKNDQGNMVRWAWLDQPDNNDWQKAGDWTKKFKRQRIIDFLIRAYKSTLAEMENSTA